MVAGSVNGLYGLICLMQELEKRLAELTVEFLKSYEKLKIEEKNTKVSELENK